MDKNIKIILQYDGTRYDGWQKQGNTEQTIQGKLEAVLSKMAGTEIEVQGAGRTDAGVHALGQTASFHIPEEFFNSLKGAADNGNTGTEYVKQYLNHYLPEDIAVIDVKEAEPRFHSRLNAVSKVYEYRIETGDKKDVFDRKYIYGLCKKLDVAAIRDAAGILTGSHDYRAFCSLKKNKKSTVRTISDIAVIEEGTKIFLRFEGNGFLYNMVRILTGTLIEAGLHEKSLKDIEEALRLQDRALAGRTAPPEGLFLLKVTY